MRPVRIILIGAGLGILVTLGGLRVAQAFGQSAAWPMGPMMAQMMGPQGTAQMMGQIVRDPQFMRSMAAACAQTMNDPAVRDGMRGAMNNAHMRKMIEQMSEMMRRR